MMRSIAQMSAGYADFGGVVAQTVFEADIG